MMIISNLVRLMKYDDSDESLLRVIVSITWREIFDAIKVNTRLMETLLAYSAYLSILISDCIQTLKSKPESLHSDCLTPLRIMTNLTRRYFVLSLFEVMFCSYGHVR